MTLSGVDTKSNYCFHGGKLTDFIWVFLSSKNWAALEIVDCFFCQFRGIGLLHLDTNEESSVSEGIMCATVTRCSNIYSAETGPASMSLPSVWATLRFDLVMLRDRHFAEYAARFRQSTCHLSIPYKRPASCLFRYCNSISFST